MRENRLTHPPFPDAAPDLIARRFAMISNVTRLRLIQALFDGEKNVTELVAVTGGTPANVSRHLQALTTAGVRARRKAGLQVFHRISDPTIPKLCDLVRGSLEKTLSQQVSPLGGSAS